MSKPTFTPKQGRLRYELESQKELYIPTPRGSKQVNSIRNSLNYAMRHGMPEYGSETGSDQEGKQILHVWLKWHKNDR